MIILGSTGSIGVNTLNIAKKFNLPVETLVAGENTELLNRQIAEFDPSFVVVSKKELVSSVKHEKVYYGEEAILEVIECSKSDTVVNALVGFLGLRPTIEAIRLGKKVALANKETLVAAGGFVDRSFITPIDSEHFGLWYLLQEKKIDRMVITASGGAFRDSPLKKLTHMSPKEALNHPNWSMGKKITVDSATMTNKLFELLEAKWLFDCSKFDAIIETKSIIHALIDFKDGSSTAHIAHADMRLPISYALMEKVDERILERVDLTKIGSLEFREIDVSRYPVWQIKDDILKNPDLGVVINAANEIAVERFLSGDIGFMDISRKIVDAYCEFEKTKINSLEDVFIINREVRKFSEA